jgi:membrane-associated protease RseP (regulator of RpoE activity)
VKEITPGLMEGQCLLYLLVKRLVVGPIPDGHDVYLTSTAFAGWTGLLITMLNLLPTGQLDGGHIAWALLDKKQARYSRYVRNLLPLVFLYNLAMWREPDPGFVWLVWFGLLLLLRRLSGGLEHPPTEPGTLTLGRRLVAIGCLVLFVLIFMPTPMRLN